jgi:uncharacterized membrane protein YjjP (DUF1212 family)
MNNNITRYEKLKAKRPSIIRVSAQSFIYWLVCTLLSFAFLVLGVALFINGGFGNWLFSQLTGTEIIVMDDVLQRITYVVAGICILLSILFFIIARFSKKIIRRTNYIVSLEELMDSELNPEPNYVEI